MYALARLYPPTREGAIRLALVTLEQMTRTLTWAVENPAQDVQVLEPPQIKRGYGEVQIAERKAASA